MMTPTLPLVAAPEGEFGSDGDPRFPRAWLMR